MLINKPDDQPGRRKPEADDQHDVRCVLIFTLKK